MGWRILGQVAEAKMEDKMPRIVVLDENGRPEIVETTEDREVTVEDLERMMEEAEDLLEAAQE